MAVAKELSAQPAHVVSSRPPRETLAAAAFDPGHIAGSEIQLQRKELKTYQKETYLPNSNRFVPVHLGADAPPPHAFKFRLLSLATYTHQALSTQSSGGPVTGEGTPAEPQAFAIK